VTEALLENPDQLHQRETERRAAAHVVRAPRHRLPPLDRREVRVDQVIDPEKIPHLEAVTVDRDREAERRGEREPRDPALIFFAKLSRPEDARLAISDRGKPVTPVVVDDVLVRRALRAAVGRLEGQRLGFGDTCGRNREVPPPVAERLASSEVTVDLVRGGVDEERCLFGRRPVPATDRFQETERSESVRAPVLEWIDDGRRHGNLRGKVKDGVEALSDDAQVVLVAHVALHETNVGMLALEPAEVVAGGRP
jgi:hypothetical protein